MEDEDERDAGEKKKRRGGIKKGNGRGKNRRKGGK